MIAPKKQIPYINYLKKIFGLHIFVNLFRARIHEETKPNIFFYDPYQIYVKTQKFCFFIFMSELYGQS